LIPPFVWQLEEQGLAIPFASVDELVAPQPMTIAVIMANSDWVKANPELVQRYMTAWLRGAREYCQAYHGASNRQEIIDELVSSKTEPRKELLEKYPWPARSPNGKINVASMTDINKWYVENKMSNKEFPASRLVDSTYIDYAIQKLGPFELQNKDSKLPGCRE
jgi:NitT/TauT family transport system substrate-binding protein